MKIAVVGGGISGMAAAYLLNRHHDVHVYEKDAQLGGHARTVDVDLADRKVAVDTGFIVFNRRNYPNLTGLFDHLQVPVAKSDMSFGVSINDGWLEYGTLRLTDIFAQKRNFLRLNFLRMIYDILRFNRQAARFAGSHPSASLEDCLRQLQMSDWFREYYLLAMAGAIWSSPVGSMRQFPAQTLINFFENHGLLSLADPIQWYTVRGGSREYVTRLTQSFKDKIRVNSGVQAVRRVEGGVEVRDSQGQWDRFDQVVLACHSDQALAMLDAPTTTERNLLSSIAYQPNQVVLHSDTSFMPKRRSAWSSWVYLSQAAQGPDPKPAVQEQLSYWMNNLQPLDCEQNLFVTLNPQRPPQQSLSQQVFHHPVFDRQAIQAQGELHHIQGQGGIWYCGAWQGHGFHEDGLVSGVRVAQQLGADVPWHR